MLSSCRRWRLDGRWRTDFCVTMMSKHPLAGSFCRFAVCMSGTNFLALAIHDPINVSPVLMRLARQKNDRVHDHEGIDSVDRPEPLLRQRYERQCLRGLTISGVR